MVFRQPLPQVLITFLGTIHDLEQPEIFGRNCPGIYHGLKINELLPIFPAVYHDENFLCQLLGLGQGQYLKEFIQSSKSAGENHQRFRKIGKPELPHEEVMELEIQ